MERPALEVADVFREHGPAWRQALDAARWRRGGAAEILGVSPRTLYRWMKRLKL